MDVAAEFHGLIVSSSGTLSENEQRELLEFIEAQDFNLAFEKLCGFLIDRQMRVPADLYIRISSLGDHLDGVDPYILENVKSFVTHFG